MAFFFSVILCIEKYLIVYYFDQYVCLFIISNEYLLFLIVLNECVLLLGYNIIHLLTSVLCCGFFYIYSRTYLNRTLLGPTFVFGIDSDWFEQVKLTKISYMGTVFKIHLIQDSSLFMVQFRQVSLYIVLDFISN